MLAIFEFFYAVRDRDIATARSLLTLQLVAPATPLLPRFFPPEGARRGRACVGGWEAGGGGGGERGEGWPTVGFEGRVGDR